MKINQIIVSESMGGTSAGAVASVAKPLGEVEKRNPVVGLKPVKDIMKGKTKKKGPYQNSLVEGKMKDIDIDLKTMSDEEFKKEYGKTKQEMRDSLKQPVKEGRMKDLAMSLHNAGRMRDIAIDLKAMDDIEFKKEYGVTKEQMRTLFDNTKKDKVEEAKLDEDDLIIVPSKGMRRKTGLIPRGQSRIDHEIEMACADLIASVKNAKSIYDMIKDRSEEEGLEGWVQEKIIKASDYLNAVKEYLDGKIQQEMMSGGVIAGGGVGEGVQSSEYSIDVTATTDSGKIINKTFNVTATDPKSAKIKLRSFLTTSVKPVLYDIQLSEPRLSYEYDKKIGRKKKQGMAKGYISDRRRFFALRKKSTQELVQMINDPATSESDRELAKRVLAKRVKDERRSGQATRDFNRSKQQGMAETKLDEKFKSKQQAKLMYAVAGDKGVAKKTGVSQKVAKEFIKKSHGQKVSKLPTKVKSKKG